MWIDVCWRTALSGKTQSPGGWRSRTDKAGRNALLLVLQEPVRFIPTSACGGIPTQSNPMAEARSKQRSISRRLSFLKMQEGISRNDDSIAPPAGKFVGPPPRTGQLPERALGQGCAAANACGTNGVIMSWRYSGTGRETLLSKSTPTCAKGNARAVMGRRIPRQSLASLPREWGEDGFVLTVRSRFHDESPRIAVLASDSLWSNSNNQLHA